ncbi:glucokinase [Actinokineospora alba]|uniref:Glucokinase n=1 Tax=Actinokineospora alba TaxID=504798 RepID=A0A1H0I808_9PSEU|nr:glucokinase [Actinokineospora alba]SDI86907.1 glucokinase [Actinokineospora alba]SDO27241.1 glucokinase [Actinokineospora alba]
MSAGAASVIPVSLVAAVDIGGTTIKAALVDGDLRVRHTLRRPTPYGADAVLDAVTKVLAELDQLADAPVAAAGVVFPGLVDETARIARFSVNLGWRDLDLADLADRTGRPTAIGHDVRAGALAEWRLGAAKGYQDVAFVPVGTGVSAAFIADGAMVVAGGYAGEIGHLVVEPDGEPCPCGGRGCLETVGSASALARRYSALTGEDVSAALEVLDRMRAGDVVAAQVWNQGVDALADTLATVVTVLAPEVVVIGGGLSGAGPALFDPLRARLGARLTFQRVPTVVAAALGDQAACLGAALLALDHLQTRSGE